MKYKKGFQYFAICWAIVFVLFNIVCLLVPKYMTGRIMPGSAYWICYFCINAAFLGQLACVWMAFKADSAQKMFYNLSLIVWGYCAVIGTGTVGLIGMMDIGLPAWAGAVVCLAILAFYAIAVVKAKAAVEIVSSIDEKIQTKTRYIRSLTATAEGIMARAGDEEIRKAAKSVYEALRYSDPMSHEKLGGIENQIAGKLAGFSTAVAAGDGETVKNMAAELTVLISDRNRQCKLLK